MARVEGDEVREREKLYHVHDKEFEFYFYYGVCFVGLFVFYRF